MQYQFESTLLFSGRDARSFAILFADDALESMPPGDVEYV